MKLCVLTTSYPRREGDDASIFIRRLVHGYAAHGAEGFVIVPRDDDEPREETQGSFTVRRFRYGVFSRGRLAFGAGMLPNVRRNPLLLLQAPLLIAGFVREAFRARRSYEFVHANWLFAGIAAYVLSLITRKPYAVSVLGEDVKLIDVPVLGAVLGVVLARARVVISVSDHFAGRLGARYPKLRKAVVVPNGVETRAVSDAERDALRSRLGLAKDCETLLFVGRVIELKGVHRLIDLLSAPGFERTVLLAAGRLQDGAYHARLEKQAADAGVTERVRFCGSIRPEEVPAYLSIASAFLSASSYEGRPNVVLEALAAGALVFVSDIPAHREVVRDGENGFILPEDSASAAALVKRILGDPARSARVRDAARRDLAGNDWNACAALHLGAFRSDR